MPTTLTIITPIFALILCGWTIRRMQWVSDATTVELNKFVVILALPALLFDTVANAQWKALWLPDFISLFFIATLLLFVFTIALSHNGQTSLSNATIDGLNASYANTGFMGFPLLLAVAGDSAKPLILIATLITVCILFALAILLLEMNCQAKAPRWQLTLNIALKLLKNPIVLAPLCASFFPLTGFTIPNIINTPFNLLGAAAAPCALVTIGLFLGGQKSTSGLVTKKSIYLVLTKLIIHPALVIGLATWCFSLPENLIYCAVLLAALPTGTGPFMLAEYYKQEPAITSESIFLSTLLSPITLAIIMLLFAP